MTYLMYLSLYLISIPLCYLAIKYMETDIWNTWTKGMRLGAILASIIPAVNSSLAFGIGLVAILFIVGNFLAYWDDDASW